MWSFHAAHVGYQVGGMHTGQRLPELSEEAKRGRTTNQIDKFRGNWIGHAMNSWGKRSLARGGR